MNVKDECSTSQGTNEKCQTTTDPIELHKRQHLVNTDFSDRISLIQKYNIENNIIWSKSKESIPLDLQTIGQEKFSRSVLIYDGITCRDLVPNHAPILSMRG